MAYSPAEAQPPPIKHDTGYGPLNSRVEKYLLKNAPIFQQLTELREKYSKFFNEMRDYQSAHTSPPRRILADSRLSTSYKDKRTFTQSMRNIRQPCILDLSVTPGGVRKAIMDISQDSNCLAFTLPPEDDWGPVRLNTTARLAFYPFDINCLAADMGAYVTKRQEPFGPNRPLHLEATPETRGLVACEHPEPGKFSVVPLLKPDDIFDLVICDARVFLGNLELQDSVEVDRMQLVQLALGLEHVRPGGKMVIRLARIESWSAVDLIHRFSQFSTLEIFKHFDVGTKWPDCYLVASNIRSKQTEAINAVSFWKQA